MYFIEDEKLARNLHQKLNGPENCPQEKEEKENVNLIDQRLEYHDPTPNVHDLFASFNKRFFWGKLGMVEVKWSNRMTTCAGLCSYQEKKGICCIKLSAPLLILRPRKDLVETLLHEMIHAYLFVTQNFNDREDHGPEFKKHMERINREAGTNITIFHTFHYEVAFYQNHVWRCNGPCRNSQPYYGFVKRAMNRAPGPNDLWWKTHQINCGGTFIKISEPQKPSKKNEEGKKGNKQVNTPGMKDIRDFLKTNVPTTSTSTNSSTSGAAPVEDFDIDEHSNSENEVGNVTNSPGTYAKTTKTDTSHSDNNNYANETDEQMGITETVRSFWTNKYPSPNGSGNKRNNPSSSTPSDPEIEEKKRQITCPICAKPFSDAVINEHVEECLEGDNSVEILTEIKTVEDDEQSIEEVLRPDLIQCPICGEALERNELNDHLEICFTFTFESEKTTADAIADTGKVPCPCCLKWVVEKNINDHIDECLTFITLKGNAGLN